jgi:hypothetical protein
MSFKSTLCYKKLQTKLLRLSDDCGYSVALAMMRVASESIMSKNKRHSAQKEKARLLLPTRFEGKTARTPKLQENNKKLDSQ